MIKNVAEIVAITKESNQRLIAERHDRTMSYINNSIAREIEKTARNGGVNVKFRVSNNVDRDTINNVLTNAGYEVSIKGYEVSVSWMMAYVKNKA